MCFRELLHIESFVVERHNVKITLRRKYSAYNDENNKCETQLVDPILCVSKICG